MFSILHISDLHRSSIEPVDNDSLVAALLADCDRYVGETPVVPPPHAIVVSGDIVQGAPVGAIAWNAVVRDQYVVATEFLDQLTRRFIDGDRSRLILVPGNHDVCWNTSLASMERVAEADYPRDVKGALTEPDSTYRWSWKDRALYRIRDADLYEQRMDAYWEFAEAFYSGVRLLRPIDRNRGYQLFALQDRRVLVAAFDSITSNDCFGYSGAIPRGAVARCNLELRDMQHSFDLRAAVWHHSINGPPLRDDYMPAEQVEEMVGLHFQLGMHGHQHVAAAATQFVHFTESESMAVVSAGSLCAGSRELPRGVNRQYNIVVVEDDLRRGRVHVREMVEGEQFGRKRNGAFVQGFADLSWQVNANSVGIARGARQENVNRSVLQAEEALHAGDARAALRLLHGVELAPGSHARHLAIKAAVDLEDWVLLAGMIDKPSSTEEGVLLVSAFIHAKSYARARSALSDAAIDAATRNALESRIQAGELMRGA